MSMGHFSFDCKLVHIFIDYRNKTIWKVVFETFKGLLSFEDFVFSLCSTSILGQTNDSFWWDSWSIFVSSQGYIIFNVLPKKYQTNLSSFVSQTSFQDFSYGFSSTPPPPAPRGTLSREQWAMSSERWAVTHE